MKSHGKVRRKIPFRWLFFVLFLIWMFALSVWIQKESEPTLRSMAKSKVNQEFQVFLTEFLTESDNYSDFLKIQYDQSGKIQSISADIGAVNRFKSQLMQSYLQSQNVCGEQTVKIPIGNLTHQPLFYGRGPSFEVKILPCQQVSFDLQDQFSSAGMNQTLHEIDLVITAEVEILLPSGVIYETVSGSIALSKTLIVGDVPQIFPSGSLLSQS